MEHAAKAYADYEIMRSHVMEQINRVEQELGKLQNARAKVLLPVNQPLREVWDGASLEWRRDVVKLVIEKIIVNPGCTNKNWSGFRFDPDLIEVVWRV